MMSFIFGFLFILTIIAFVFGAISAMDDDYAKSFAALVIIVVSILGMLYINANDAKWALEEKIIEVKYAQINAIGSYSITLDESKWDGRNELIEENYPLDLSQFHVGDIVQYKYLQGNLKNYLVEINKVD